MLLSSGVFNIPSILAFLSKLISSVGSYSLIVHPYKLLASTYNIFLFSSDGTYLSLITRLITPLILFSSKNIIYLILKCLYIGISIFHLTLPSVTR